jgi:hypothetical protein
MVPMDKKVMLATIRYRVETKALVTIDRTIQYLRGNTSEDLDVLADELSQARGQVEDLLLELDGPA